MIIGIISCAIALIPYIGLMSLPIGVVAIILGIVGLTVKHQRRGQAIAGLLTGIGSIVLAVLVTGLASPSSSSNVAPPTVAAAGSSAAAPVTPKASAVPSPTQTPTAPVTSVRGNQILKVGQGVSVNLPDGTPAVTFVVNGITIDPQCTGPIAQAPENGHFVALDMSVQTTSALQSLTFTHTFSFSPILWKAIAANGTTFNGSVLSFQASSCLPNGQELTPEIGPGEKVHGILIFDVPTTSGVLVFNPYTGPSWEISYGSAPGA